MFAFLKSRLGVPVLVLLLSCLWAGAFFLLNSRLGAPLFCFEFTPLDWCGPNENHSLPAQAHLLSVSAFSLVEMYERCHRSVPNGHQGLHGFRTIGKPAESSTE